jgi:hypothetical protein
LFTAIGFHSGDARLSRRSIRLHTDKFLRETSLKRPCVSSHALRHTAAALGYVVDMAKKNPALFIPVKVG